MNTIATILLAGSVAAVPTASITDVLPTNPFTGVSIAAAGIGVELNADGLETHPVKHTDFQIEIQMKSGSPIRVRL